MKNKVLKLCKRLNKITIEEILPILMATEGEVTPIIKELQAEGLLEDREDGVYFYKEKTKEKQPLFIEVRTKEEMNLIIRCFCIGLATIKAGFIINYSNDVVNKYYRFFRKHIYEDQLKELKRLYDEKPQIARMRTFFDKPVYFYYYNNKTWVVPKPFITGAVEKNMSKEDVLNFKTDYMRISRRMVLHQTTSYLEHHIAEIIWKLNNPNQEELVDYIYEKLNFAR